MTYSPANHCTYQMRSVPPKRKNSHMRMFILMLIVMMLMARIAAVGFSNRQVTLVEVILPDIHNEAFFMQFDSPRFMFTEPAYLSHLFYFAVKNISGQALTAEISHEIITLAQYEEYLYHEPFGQFFFELDVDETALFVYGGGGNMPMEFDFPLSKNNYAFAVVIVFDSSEQSHRIRIVGHNFVVE